MDVSVVIPARDAAGTVGTAIASVQAQDPPVDEIVVAVGPEGRTPPEGSATWAAVARAAADDARIRPVANPSGGTPQGLNAAIAATSGEVIVRVDAHAVLPAGYVARAVAVLEETGAGNVGGRQDPVGERTLQRGIAAAMRSRVGSGGAAYRGATEGGPVDTVYLGVFRREALDSVGGYDQRMTRNQDYELNLRLREAGWTVWYDPALVVAYRPRPSFPALARQYLDYGRWRRLSARLHPGTLRLRQVLPPVLVGGAIALLVAATVRVIPWWAVAGVTIAYALAVAADTRRHAGGPVEWASAVLAVAVMHTSWGLGFLIGPPRGAADPR